MKQFAKVLVLTTLIAVGCLIAPRIAKAAIGSVTVSCDGSKLTYSSTGTITGVSTLDVYVDGTLVDTISPAPASGTIVSGEANVISYLGGDTFDTETDVTVRVELSDEDSGAIDSKDITVYVGKAEADGDTKIVVTAPATPIRSLNPNQTFTVTAKALAAPYYIDTVAGEAKEVTSFSGSTFKVSQGTIVVTAGTATPSLTFDHTDVSPITGTISWTPNTVQYPYNDFNTAFTPAEGTVSQSYYSYPTVKYTFNGSGSGVATYDVGMNSSAEYSETFPFNYAASVKKVVITSGKSKIIKNAEEPYEAKVYLDAAGSQLAANQNILWSISGPGATVTPEDPTATDTGAVVQATAIGTFTLTAKSAEDDTILATKTITVENPSETVDYVEIDPACPTAIAVKTSGTYKATVKLTDGTYSKNGVTWSVDNTALATISSSGVLTAKNTTGTVKVIAKAVSDPSKYDEFPVEIKAKVETGTISYKSTEGGVLKITKAYDSSSDHKLDLGWKKGAVGANEGASVSTLTYNITGDTSTGTFTTNGVFTPKTADKTITITPKVTYTDGTTDTRDADSITLEVLKDWTTKLESGGSSSSSSTSSDYYIGFKLDNNEVYTGYDTSKNIHDIGGYRIDVMKDGNSLASKTYTKSMSIGTTYKVEKDDLNELLKDASGDLSGDSTTVTFRISPYGANQLGNKVYNTAAAKTIERTVYRDNGRYYLDKNGSSSSSSSSSKSASTAAGGGGNAGANLDKVPKTGEGNTRLLILMVAIISASVAASILLSTLPAKKKIGNEEGVDDKDIFHKKD